MASANAACAKASTNAEAPLLVSQRSGSAEPRALFGGEETEQDRRISHLDAGRRGSKSVKLMHEPSPKFVPFSSVEHSSLILPVMVWGGGSLGG